MNRKKHKAILRLKKCKVDLRDVETFSEALRILKRYNLRMASSGRAGRNTEDEPLYYSYYNHNGLPENPCGIVIIYTMRRVAADLLQGDQIEDILLCPI